MRTRCLPLLRISNPHKLKTYQGAGHNSVTASPSLHVTALRSKKEMEAILLIACLLAFLFPLAGLFGIFFSEGKKGTLLAAAMLTLGTMGIPFGCIFIFNAYEKSMSAWGGRAQEVQVEYALYGLPLGILISYIAITIKENHQKKRSLNQAR